MANIFTDSVKPDLLNSFFTPIAIFNSTIILYCNLNMSIIMRYDDCKSLNVHTKSCGWRGWRCLKVPLLCLF